MKSLVFSLSAQGIQAVKSKPRIPVLAVLVLLSPLAPIFYRIIGYQVIHIHWTAGQFRPPRPRGKFANQFFYHWFQLFLVMVKISGMKLVWTAHNFMPHEPVFNDDFAARRLLAKRCDAVVALNHENFAAIEKTFSPRNLVLIPAAEPPILPTISKHDMRVNLGINPNDLHFAALGHIREYKGPDIFLKAILQLQADNFFTLAGSAVDNEFTKEIRELSDRVKIKHNLNLDLRFLSEDELANLIIATDFLICPFRQISNSGIINLGLQVGIPLILPDLGSLSWVPRGAALWYPVEEGEQGLAKAMRLASILSESERQAMSAAASSSDYGISWGSYVQQTGNLYKSLLGKS